MARSSDMAKKIMRFKLQLSDTAKPATVLKVLQKLKDLDVTLDILAETGIGKTVNSLRRHKQAGELAKSLVKGWKKLIPKQSTSHGESRCLQETVSIETVEDDQSCPENGYSSNEDEQNNSLTSNGKNQTISDDDSFKTRSRKNYLEKGRSEEKGRKSKDDKNTERSQQGSLLQNILMSKTEIQDDKTEKKKKKRSEALLANENMNGGPQKSRCDSRVTLKSAYRNGSSASEQKSKSKSSKESSVESKDFFSSSDKPSKKLKEAKDGRSSETSTSSETQRRKRKKNEPEKHDRLKYKPDSENNERSKHKKAKMERKEKERKSDEEEPFLSFESYLNYDVNLKRKDQSGVKKAPKTIKNVTKGQTKTPDMEPSKPPASNPEEKPQESLMHLMNVPLPAALPELEKPSSIVYYFESKADKEPDFCDEESVVFTGQRLNSKMQVYSGAKTLFLPAMMSLYQQCIRTLQNNINLLYETGGVPFELLEPVLERCTPEQLLRIEEYNPIYMGLTDHLWGKHCRRDFKDCRLQEYESWKEMYIRVSEERERKLRRLTKSIVSAHSKKPKGRQVKMAFIHTVAKPPRDVRIQQEIHGTAVQQPHLLKCSVKGQENQTRPSFNEPNRPSSTSSGGSNNQDLRKKTRVAPMMAKSLKAFKKQLGRR